MISIAATRAFPSTVGTGRCQRGPERAIRGELRVRAGGGGLMALRPITLRVNGTTGGRLRRPER
jgi:hypothetical protein